MGKQRVDFELGTDTGEREDSDAIQPYENGERINETTLNRPNENIRYRTESARSVLEDQMYLSDVSMRWIMHGGDTAPTGDYIAGAQGRVVSWDPDAHGIGDPWDVPNDPYRGPFEIFGNLAVESVLSLAQDAHHTEAFYCENAVPARSYTLYLTSMFQAAEGGDLIYVNWRYEDSLGNPFPSGHLNVFASGDPKHTINVEVAGDGSVTLAAVQAALEADTDIYDPPAAGKSYLVDITDDSGDTGTVIDTTDTAAPAQGVYVFDRESQREIHIISDATLTSFFSFSPVSAPYSFINQLKDGDTLAIYYPYIKDPDGFFGDHEDTGEVGGRRQATLMNEVFSNVINVGTSQLFNTSVEPEKIPQSIPICKRIGDDLIFLDGTYITEDSVTSPSTGVYFGEHGKTVERIFSIPTTLSIPLTNTWCGPTPLSGGDTIEDHFENILGDLGNNTSDTYGTGLIGAAQVSNTGYSEIDTTLVQGCLYSQLSQLVGSCNDRAAITADETITGNWQFDDQTTFNTGHHLQLGDWATYGESPTDAWKLFYRFQCDGDDVNDVYFYTQSWYVLEHAAPPVDQGAILMTVGCIPDPTAGLTDFIAAPDAAGSGTCAAMLWSSTEGMSYSQIFGETAGASFNFSDHENTYMLAGDEPDIGWSSIFVEPVVLKGGTNVMLDPNDGGHIVARASSDNSGTLVTLFRTLSGPSGHTASRWYYIDQPTDTVIGDHDIGMTCTMVTHNCYFYAGTDTWYKDQHGEPASMCVYTGWGVRWYYQKHDTNSWITLFDSWYDWVEESPSAHPNQVNGGGETPLGRFSHFPTPLFFTTGSAGLEPGDVKLISRGIDWLERWCWASLLVSEEAFTTHPTYVNMGMGDGTGDQDGLRCDTKFIYFDTGSEEFKFYQSVIDDDAVDNICVKNAGLSEGNLSYVKLTLSSTDLKMEHAKSEVPGSTLHVAGTLMPVLKESTSTTRVPGDWT